MKVVDNREEAEDDMLLINNNIEKFGCHLTLIPEDNYLPGFVYSIGLYKRFAHPEIICFGLDPEVAAGIINHACDLIKNGETLQTHQLYPGFLEGYAIQFLPVDKNYYPNYVGYAGWYYQTFDFPVIQLTWPDKQHRFPWEGNFHTAWKFMQPLLDRNTDFKFYEERNVAVFTTKQAFNGDPILFVYHNDDGDWQFHTSAEPDLADSIIVCLEEICALDPSVNELFHLPYGGRAWRNSQENAWQWEGSVGK